MENSQKILQERVSEILKDADILFDSIKATQEDDDIYYLEIVLDGYHDAAQAIISVLKENNLMVLRDASQVQVTYSSFFDTTTYLIEWQPTGQGVQNEEE